MPKVSQKTIANKLGLSQRAVSKALTGQPGVSPATRETVTSLARKLGYQSNRLARSLIDGKTKIIGALTPGLSGLYLSQLFDAVNQTLAKHGYNVLIAQWQLCHEEDDREVDTLLQYCVDGIVAMPRTRVPFEQTIYPALIKQGKRIVFVNEKYNGDGACSVYSDDLPGSLEAMRFLLSQGHRHIACLETGGELSTAFVLRRQGYRRALAETGIEFRPDYVCNADKHDVGNWLPKLIAEHPAVSAVFCFSDTAALQAVDILESQGLRVPDDIAVIGYGNDIPYPEHMRVPLTTVNQCAETVGTVAAESLLKLLTGQPVQAHIAVPTRLVVRQSASAKHTQSQAFEQGTQ